MGNLQRLRKFLAGNVQRNKEDLRGSHSAHGHGLGVGTEGLRGLTLLKIEGSGIID